MRLFRRRVRATKAGKVVSIKVGARTRISVECDDGEICRYFATDAKVKVGQRVRKWTRLGLV